MEISRLLNPNLLQVSGDLTLIPARVQDHLKLSCFIVVVKAGLLELLRLLRMRGEVVTEWSNGLLLVFIRSSVFHSYAFAWHILLGLFGSCDTSGLVASLPGCLFGYFALKTCTL